MEQKKGGCFLAIQTLRYENHGLIVVDQTRLPGEIRYVTLQTAAEVARAIRDMLVRGAPAIGVAGAYGVALAARGLPDLSGGDWLAALEREGALIASARPTAVNLTWAVERMLSLARQKAALPLPSLCALLEREAAAIHGEDAAINRAIGENLLFLLHDGDTILTHCNAGALATSAYGTALAPLYLAKERGMTLRAYADETRPRLQGAKLTALELQKAGVDVTLIADNMAAVVMAAGKIDAVIVGCDRVAKNGDTANKIGTFGLSILARHFGIPFYIAAPTPTIDFACPDGAHIPIEERDGREITHIGETRIAPEGIKTFNPAFDVTPAGQITAIVTERGVAYPPFSDSLGRWAPKLEQK